MVRVVAVVFSLYGVNNVCMCACLTGKMSHHSGAAAGCIHLAFVCVRERESEKDRKSGCEGQMPLCTIAYSLTFFFFLLLSLLYFSSSFSFPHILSSFLSFLRRALVSPWQVGIEEQPR